MHGVAGARWFFREVVEPLCDSFDPDLQHRHDELLARVIAEWARTNAEFRVQLARRLAGRDLLERRARTTGSAAWTAAAPDLCVLPSRVTIGADIAVTATIAGVVRAAWPDTRIAVAGSVSRLEPLFGGRHGMEIWEHEYPRHGTIADRLAVWLDVAGAVETWRHEHPAARLLVLDPDSRITQLGLLPLAVGAAERLFPSRGTPGTDRRGLAELAAEWAAKVTGLERVSPPGDRIRPRDRDVSWSGSLAHDLRATLRRPVVFASLGVGGNPRKAATAAMESEVLAGLAAHAAVVLDSGAAAAEVERAMEVSLHWAARTGGTVRQVRVGVPSSVATGQSPELTLLRGADLSTVTALLGYADVFVGYDSACQHIAAAVGTPGVVVFVDPPSPTFVHRWCAPGMSAVVVDRASDAGCSNATDRVQRAALTELNRAFQPSGQRSRRTR